MTKITEDELAVLDGRYVPYRELHSILEESGKSTAASVMASLQPTLLHIQNDLNNMKDLHKKEIEACLTAGPPQISKAQIGIIGGTAAGGGTVLVTLLYLIIKLLGIPI